MTKIEATLFEQTAILKEEYIAKTTEFATNYFNRAVAYVAEGEKKHFDEYGFKYRSYNEGTPQEYCMIDPSQRRSKVYTEFQKRNTDLKNAAAYKEVEKFVAKEVRLATEHYEQSIVKLAKRIEDLGLNLETLKMETGRVGVNIETRITDGVRSVRAWTIVASGAIIKPHYRYLIK